jgi:pyruvate formate lyase activating enzyme
VEITTLVIPDENDKDFEKIAQFIASVDKNIPWHISRFFPMYKMLDKTATPIDVLRKAEKIGKKYLKYVYIGNV